uniref:E3 ubiquitin-protein ligase n=1 Tax=Neogobius melanostomus TaxID=47308 RepID=A0A8C6SAN5_9GOBI
LKEINFNITEELGVQLLLLAPLEWLLLGAEPTAALAALKEGNRDSALCGHVFRVGEPTYSCRECAADPTCVLCMNCFLQSVHKDHRYRAWKQGPSCRGHTPKDPEQDLEHDPLQSLDPDLVSRAFSGVRSRPEIRRGHVDLGPRGQSSTGLEPPDKGDTFYCMLFNDEVHTYEQVIYTLQKAVNCSQKEAVSFATPSTARFGRTSVRFGDFQFCEQAKSIIVEHGRQSKPLKVQVMHSSVVAHQVFALRTLGWLSQVISCSGESAPDSKMWKGLKLNLLPTRLHYYYLLMNPLFKPCYDHYHALSQVQSGLGRRGTANQLEPAGHMVETFRYQVSPGGEVSIHLPLCRMLIKMWVLLATGLHMESQTAGLYLGQGKMEVTDCGVCMGQEDWESYTARLTVFQDVLQQNNTMIEEMLHLVIMVTSERFSPGVGDVEPLDEVRREIIHQLCIRPMAHSELLKDKFPYGDNKVNKQVQDDVLVCRKPGVTGRGLYELKPEWSKHFNLYFHHYSRADQSKASITPLHPTNQRPVSHRYKGTVTDGQEAERSVSSNRQRLRREKVMVRAEGGAMVLAAFVQRSTVLCQNRQSPSTDVLFMNSDLALGIHTASCGHIMHATCWQRYFEAVQQKEQSHSFDVENGEFLCPLCECLSNTVIPLLPPSLEMWMSATRMQLEALRRRERSARGRSLWYLRGPLSSGLSEMMTTFSLAVYKVGLKTNPNDQDPRLAQPLFGSLPCRQVSPVRVRGESACRQVSLSGSGGMLITVLSALVSEAPPPDVPCFLDIDMFHLLVSVVLSFSAVQALDQSGRISTDSAHLHLLHLVTVAHLVQALLSSRSGSGQEVESVMCVPSALPPPASGWQLWRGVKAALLPFLRSAAMFFHYLHSTAPPAELLGDDQWEALCSYLNLPSNLLLLYSQQRPPLEPPVLVRFPRASNRLVDLPEDYSVLINQASSFTCPRSAGDQARAPTLCLVCGTLLCSQSYCCQTELDGDDLGACTYHALTCGAGAGLFLRVRECCFYPPPYLDDYGETDQGLKRGNPLRLCRERYLKIQRLWRQHALAEVIGHAQEANQTLAAIDWQHL